MKLLKNCYLEIHYLTYIYFIIAICGGYFIPYLLSLMIVFVHELCHLLMAYCFSFDIEKIEVLPFGAYLTLKDFYFHPIKEELCVVLAGPCCHLFLYFLFQNDVFLPYQQYLLHMNTLIFFFNCLPVYPMDGHRVICLFLQSTIDLKNAMYLSLKISIFFLIIISIFYGQVSTIVILGYLWTQQIFFIQYIPSYLRQYFSQIPSLYPRYHKKINYQFTYRRGYVNYYFIDNQLYHEERMVFELLKHVK